MGRARTRFKRPCRRSLAVRQERAEGAEPDYTRSWVRVPLRMEPCDLKRPDSLGLEVVEICGIGSAAREPQISRSTGRSEAPFYQRGPGSRARHSLPWRDRQTARAPCLGFSDPMAPMVGLATTRRPPRDRSRRRAPRTRACRQCRSGAGRARRVRVRSARAQGGYRRCADRTSTTRRPDKPPSRPRYPRAGRAEAARRRSPGPCRTAPGCSGRGKARPRDACRRGYADTRAQGLGRGAGRAGPVRGDVLNNNAGISRADHPTTPDGEDVRVVVNTCAPALLTRLLLPRIPARGRLVRLSSAAQAPVDLDAMTGSKPLEAMDAYSQSKLALTLWSAALTADLGPTWGRAGRSRWP